MYMICEAINIRPHRILPFCHLSLNNVTAIFNNVTERADVLFKNMLTTIKLLFTINVKSTLNNFYRKSVYSLRKKKFIQLIAFITNLNDKFGGFSLCSSAIIPLETGKCSDNFHSYMFMTH